MAVAGMYHRDVWWAKLWLSFNVAVGDASKPWETTVAGPLRGGLGEGGHLAAAAWVGL